MGITMNPLVLSGLIAKRMKDLILDEMIGKELDHEVMFEEDECVELFKEIMLILKFSDLSSLRCFSDDCCANVRLAYAPNNNLGVVTDWNIEVEEQRDMEIFESTTTTVLTLKFEDQTINTYTFIGESNGYYDESVHFEWTNS